MTRKWGKRPNTTGLKHFTRVLEENPAPQNTQLCHFRHLFPSGPAALPGWPDLTSPPGCGGICNQTGSAGWQKDVGWLDPPGEVNRLRKFTGGYCPPSLLQTQKSGETAVKKGPEIKFRKCAPGSPFSANFRQAQHQNKQTSRVKAKKVAGLKTAAVRMKKKRAKRTITLCLNYFRGTPF